MAEEPTALEPNVLHQLKNCLSIVVGYCDLLVAELPEGDPRRADIVEILKAGRDAMNLVPEIARRLRS